MLVRYLIVVGRRALVFLYQFGFSETEESNWIDVDAKNLLPKELVGFLSSSRVLRCQGALLLLTAFQEFLPVGRVEVFHLVGLYGEFGLREKTNSLLEESSMRGALFGPGNLLAIVMLPEFYSRRCG